LELGVQISGFLPFQVVTGKGGGDMRSGVANRRANIWTYERARIQKPIIINYGLSLRVSWIIKSRPVEEIKIINDNIDALSIIDYILL
jgi:hypothetical protein